MAGLGVGRLSEPTVPVLSSCFLTPRMTFDESLTSLASTGPSIKFQVLMDWEMKDSKASGEFIYSALYTQHLKEISCNRRSGGWRMCGLRLTMT